MCVFFILELPFTCSKCDQNRSNWNCTNVHGHLCTLFQISNPKWYLGYQIGHTFHSVFHSWKVISGAFHFRVITLKYHFSSLLVLNLPVSWSDFSNSLTISTTLVTVSVIFPKLSSPSFSMDSLSYIWNKVLFSAELISGLDCSRRSLTS